MRLRRRRSRPRARDRWCRIRASTRSATPRRQRAAREHVVEPPADVALAHVPPRRPPGEQARRCRDPARGRRRAGRRVEDAFEQRAFLGTLADEAVVALLGVDVHLGARDVEVAAQHDAIAGRAQRGRVRRHRLEEAHLGGEVLAAVGHVDRRDQRARHAHRRRCASRRRSPGARTSAGPASTPCARAARRPNSPSCRASSTSSRRSSPTGLGMWSRAALISCRHRTSGCSRVTNAATSSWRARMPFTFQVAIFTGGAPRFI